MPLSRRPVVLVLVLAGLGLPACGNSGGFDSEAAGDQGPSKVLPARGGGFAQVVLTAKAAQRIGIRTTAVRSGSRAGARARRTVIPYAAVLYDPQGHAFAYTNPRRLVYVRSPIRIDRIEGRRAVLSSGPPSGTPVVTVGAAELLGVEYGVEED
jgi:hypothetical protein